jgi:hypothetical protein
MKSLNKKNRVSDRSHVGRILRSGLTVSPGRRKTPLRVKWMQGKIELKREEELAGKENAAALRPKG